MIRYEIQKFDSLNWKVVRIEEGKEVHVKKDGKPTGEVVKKDVVSDAGYFPRLDQAAMAVYEFALKDGVLTADLSNFEEVRTLTMFGREQAADAIKIVIAEP